MPTTTGNQNQTATNLSTNQVLNTTLNSSLSSSKLLLTSPGAFGPYPTLVINDVPQDVLIIEGRPSRSFFGWLKAVYLICFSQQQNGPTTQRPTINLYVGRRYFDTTLGLPVYVKSVKPVAWVNAAGLPV